MMLLGSMVMLAGLPVGKVADPVSSGNQAYRTAVNCQSVEDVCAAAGVQTPPTPMSSSVMLGSNRAELSLIRNPPHHVLVGFKQR